MNRPPKKTFLSRLANAGVVFRYIAESAGIIRQGARFTDKWLLFRYYLKIPAFVFKSLGTGKTFRELEEENKLLRGNVTLRNQSGIFYCGNNILTIYTVNKNNEKNLYRYIDLKNGVFIDVGAHIGKYSIKVAQHPSTKVIAIEPDAYNFSLLKKNIALNGISNVVCINQGAFSSPGQLPFYTAGAGEGMHSINRREATQQETSIEVDTLDHIIRRLAIDEPIRLIKIDVEGAEAEVLKGANEILQQHHPDLVIEIWKENITARSQIIEYLQRFGYDFAQVDEENYFFSTRSLSL